MERHENEIHCIAGCGKCCPPTCREKTKDGLCLAHPQITGKDDQRFLCGSLTPVMAVRKMEAACPPVIDVIVKKTGINPRVICKEQIFYTSLRSPKSYISPSGSMLDKDHLRELMKMKVRE